MKQKVIKSLLVLLSLTALTACPSQTRSGNPPVGQLQAPPPVNPQNPVSNPTSLDPKWRQFNCEFEGWHKTTNKFLWFEREGYVDIGKNLVTTTVYDDYNNRPFTVNLRNEFINKIGKLFSNAQFGTMKLIFEPAGMNTNKAKTDTVTLIHNGVEGSNVSQSGFAGDVVSITTQFGDQLYVSVSCKGASKFKTAPVSTKTNLVCKGKSSLRNSAEREVNESFPLNSIRADEEFQISDTLYAKLDSKQTTITYRGSLDTDLNYAPEITTTGTLLTPAKYSLFDKHLKHTFLDVTCQLQ